MVRQNHLPTTGNDFENTPAIGADYTKLMQKGPVKSDSEGFTKEQIQQLRAVLKKMKEEELGK